MHLSNSMRSGLVGVVSLAFAIASSQIATPAQAAPAPTPPVAAAASLPPADSGASDDTAAIAQAADDYQVGDAAAAAELAARLYLCSHPNFSHALTKLADIGPGWVLDLLGFGGCVTLARQLGWLR